MTDDFFKKEEASTQTETKDTGQEDVAKVKVGDAEFTPDELQEIVGAGIKLRDIESKQGQPIDDVLSSWGKRGEQIGKWKQVTGAENPDEFKKPEAPALTDDETVKNQVIEEAKKYGLLTREEATQMVNDIYQQNRAGEKLLSQVNRVIREAKVDGKPEVDPEKLLEFMADPSNPKDPEKAYKIMFEAELEKWKEDRLGTLKKTPVITETKSTAGAKEFKPPQVTRANLPSVLSDYLKSSGEGQ